MGTTQPTHTCYFMTTFLLTLALSGGMEGGGVEEWGEEEWMCGVGGVEGGVV